MNSWIIKHFDAFLDNHCLDVDLFGKCFGKCREFLEYLEHIHDGYVDVKRVDYNNMSITYESYICSIKLIDCICCFDNINDFQKQALIMADKSPIIADRIPVECAVMKGRKFNHYNSNVYIKETDIVQLVGFLHWVILIDKTTEQYILDPTIKQFHTPPPVLIARV